MAIASTYSARGPLTLTGDLLHTVTRLGSLGSPVRKMVRVFQTSKQAALLQDTDSLQPCEAMRNHLRAQGGGGIPCVRRDQLQPSKYHEDPHRTTLLLCSGRKTRVRV